MNPALFDPSLPPLPVSVSLLRSRWQTQIQLNVQRGLSAVSHLIPSQPPNLQLSYRSLLCFSLQVPSLPWWSWKHTPLDRNPTDVAAVVVEGCEANTINTRAVTHCDLFNVGGLIAANCCHIPNGDQFSQKTARAEVDSLLSLMLISTVFRWGLSSSSISSRPRTLIAPSALFRLSV